MTGRISIRSSSVSSSSSVTRSSPRTTSTLSGRRFSSFSTSLTRRGPLTSTSRTGWFKRIFMGAYLHLRVPQERRGFLRWNRVNVEPGPPLKARDLRQLGHDLDVPVVKLAGPLVQRRGVQDEIERGRTQDPIHPPQRVREDPRQ